MQNRQSQLTNIFSKSFTSANLFEFSLVRYDDPNLPFYKPRYFTFFSFIPGVQDQNGRTFDRSQKIIMKVSLEKVLSIAYSIKAVVNRYNQTVYPNYSIQTDSSRSAYGGNSGFKMCFCSEFTDKKNKRKISFSIKANQNQPFGITLEPVEALALADIFELVGKHGLKLELNTKRTFVGQNNNNNTNITENDSGFPPFTANTENHPPQQQNNNNSDVIDDVSRGFGVDDVPF